MQAFAVIQEAFHLAWFKRVRLLKALAFPLIILLGLTLSFPEAPSTGYTVVASLVSLVTYSMALICTHRILLLGDDSVPEWGIHTFTVREMLFMMIVGISETRYSILYAMLKLPKVVLLFATILICLLLIRLCIMLPALAVDKWLSPRQAWKLTKNHQFQLFLIIILPALLFRLLDRFFVANFPPLLQYPTAAILSLANLVIAIASISIAYREIILLSFDKK